MEGTPGVTGTGRISKGTKIIAALKLHWRKSRNMMGNSQSGSSERIARGSTIMKIGDIAFKINVDSTSKVLLHK